MIPSLSDLISQMEGVSGATDIDPDLPLTQISDVDSMDLMEWLYEFQTQSPDVGADASIFADEDGRTTLRTVHQRLVSGVSAVAAVD